MKKLNVGDFAFCDKGDLGLVLWKNQFVTKRTKKKYTLYSGINLTPGKRWGLNWQSKSPQKATRTQLKKVMEGRLIKYE